VGRPRTIRFQAAAGAVLAGVVVVAVAPFSIASGVIDGPVAAVGTNMEAN